MPDLQVGEHQWSVASGANLLDVLLEAGVRVPYSCRAGSCHACLVHCIRGDVLDAQPEALDARRHEQGWRLACQCRVASDIHLEVFDPQRDGVPALVHACDWLTDDVLRLRLQAQRPVRYQAGQHVVLWASDGTARPYSLASVPAEDDWLEFHIDCRRPGSFANAARGLKVGDMVRLGEQRGGALHYDEDWQDRPLLLLASGTGLAPLWGLLREALRLEHNGPIQVVHVAREHYLREALQELAGRWANLDVQCVDEAESAAFLAGVRLVSRRTVALLCGSSAHVDAFARRLYLAGVPRNQVFADVFLSRAD